MWHHWCQVNPELRDHGAGSVQATLERLHELKTVYYENAVQQGALSLRPGVLSLITQAREHDLQLAIATTTSPVNIAVLLRSALGSAWRSHFRAVGDANNAPLKKPHPQVYLHVLSEMGLPAAEGLAFEDSANGLRAATAAGLTTIITPTGFTAHHSFSGALRVLPDLGHASLAQLQAWHAGQQQALA
jgi:HAD superfamily hydrolase (TIGR01509 family)